MTSWDRSFKVPKINVAIGHEFSHDVVTQMRVKLGKDLIHGGEWVLGGKGVNGAWWAPFSQDGLVLMG